MEDNNRKDGKDGITFLDEKKGSYKEKLDISSEKYVDLVSKIKETYFDPFFEDRYWRLDKIELIKNDELEKKYHETLAAMADKGLTDIESREVYLFSGGSAKTCDEICKDGHRTGLKKRPVLGHTGQGIHFVQHYDLLTRYLASLQFKSSVFVVVYKAVLGKAKKVNIFTSKDDAEPTVPDPDFHCFIPEQQVGPQQLIGDAVDCSYVYIYEFDQSSTPVRCPRRTFPYALLKLERKPCIKLSGPFLAVESGISDLRWEVKGETRRGFRWNITKKASTQSLKQTVDQVRRRRSQSKEKSQKQQSSTEDCPPVLNRFDKEKTAKAKASGDEPPVLDKHSVIDNIVKEIGSKKDRILQIKHERHARSTFSIAAEESCTDKHGTGIRRGKFDESMCSAENMKPGEIFLENCANNKTNKDVKIIEENKTNKPIQPLASNVQGSLQIRSQSTNNVETFNRQAGKTAVSKAKQVRNVSSNQCHSMNLPNSMKPFINLTRIDSNERRNSPKPHRLPADLMFDNVVELQPVADHSSDKQTLEVDLKVPPKQNDMTVSITDLCIRECPDSLLTEKSASDNVVISETDMKKLGGCECGYKSLFKNCVLSAKEVNKEFTCARLQKMNILECSNTDNSKDFNSYSNFKHSSVKTSAAFAVEDKIEPGKLINKECKLSSDLSQKVRYTSEKSGKTKNCLHPTEKHKDIIKHNTTNEKKNTKASLLNEKNLSACTKGAPVSKAEKEMKGSECKKNSRQISTSKSSICDPNVDKSIINDPYMAESHQPSNSSSRETRKETKMKSQPLLKHLMQENTNKNKSVSTSDIIRDSKLYKSLSAGEVSQMDTLSPEKLIMKFKVKAVCNNSLVRNSDCDKNTAHTEALYSNKYKNKCTQSKTSQPSVTSRKKTNKRNCDMQYDSHHQTTLTPEPNSKPQTKSKHPGTMGDFIGKPKTVSSKKSLNHSRSADSLDNRKSFDITVTTKRSKHLQQSLNSCDYTKNKFDNVNLEHTRMQRVNMLQHFKHRGKETKQSSKHREVDITKGTLKGLSLEQCEYMAGLQLKSVDLNTSLSTNKNEAHNCCLVSPEINNNVSKSCTLTNTNGFQTSKENQYIEHNFRNIQTSSVAGDLKSGNELQKTIKGAPEELQVKKAKESSIGIAAQKASDTLGIAQKEIVSMNSASDLSHCLPSERPGMETSISPPAGCEAPCLLDILPSVSAACKNTSAYSSVDVGDNCLYEQQTNSAINENTPFTAVKSVDNCNLPLPNMIYLASGNLPQLGHILTTDKALSDEWKRSETQKVDNHVTADTSRIPTNSVHFNDNQTQNHKTEIFSNLEGLSVNTDTHSLTTEHSPADISKASVITEKKSVVGKKVTKVDADTARKLQQFLQKSLDLAHKKKFLTKNLHNSQTHQEQRNTDCAGDVRSLLPKTFFDFNDPEVNVSESTYVNQSVSLSQSHNVMTNSFMPTTERSHPDSMISSNRAVSSDTNSSVTFAKPTLYRSDSQETVIGGITDSPCTSALLCSPVEELSNHQRSSIDERMSQSFNVSLNEYPVDLTVSKLTETNPNDTESRSLHSGSSYLSLVSGKSVEGRNIHTLAHPLDLTKKHTQTSSLFSPNKVTSKHEVNKADETKSNLKCEPTLSAKNTSQPTTQETQSEITKTLIQLSQVLQEISKLSEAKNTKNTQQSQQAVKLHRTTDDHKKQHTHDFLKLNKDFRKSNENTVGKEKVDKGQIHVPVSKTKEKVEASSYKVETNNKQLMEDNNSIADILNSKLKLKKYSKQIPTNSQANLSKSDSEQKGKESSDFANLPDKKPAVLTSSGPLFQDSQFKICSDQIHETQDNMSALVVCSNSIQRKHHIIKCEPQSDIPEGTLRSVTSEDKIPVTSDGKTVSDLSLSLVSKIKVEPLDFDYDISEQQKQTIIAKRPDVLDSGSIPIIANLKAENNTELAKTSEAYSHSEKKLIETSRESKNISENPSPSVLDKRTGDDVINVETGSAKSGVIEQKQTNVEETTTLQNPTETSKFENTDSQLNTTIEMPCVYPENDDTRGHNSDPYDDVSSEESTSINEKVQEVTVRFNRGNTIINAENSGLNIVDPVNTYESTNKNQIFTCSSEKHYAQMNAAQNLGDDGLKPYSETSAAVCEIPTVFDCHDEPDITLLETFGNPCLKKELCTEVICLRPTIKEEIESSVQDGPVVKAKTKLLEKPDDNSIHVELKTKRKQAAVGIWAKRKPTFDAQKGRLNKGGKFVSGIRKSAQVKEVRKPVLNQTATIASCDSTKESEENHLPDVYPKQPKNHSRSDRESVTIRNDEMLETDRSNSCTQKVPHSNQDLETSEVQGNTGPVSNLGELYTKDILHSDKHISGRKRIRHPSREKDAKRVCNTSNNGILSESSSKENTPKKHISTDKPKDPNIKTFDELKKWKWRNRGFFSNRPYTKNIARRYQFYQFGTKSKFLNSARNGLGKSISKEPNSFEQTNGNKLQICGDVSDDDFYNLGICQKGRDGPNKTDKETPNLNRRRNKSRIDKHKPPSDNRDSLQNEVRSSDQYFSDDSFDGFDAFKYRVENKDESKLNKKILNANSNKIGNKSSNKQQGFKKQNKTNTSRRADISDVTKPVPTVKRVLTESERRAEREIATKEIEEAVRHLRRTYEGTWEDMIADGKVASFLEKITDKFEVIQNKRNKRESEIQSKFDAPKTYRNNCREWWQQIGTYKPKVANAVNMQKKQVLSDAKVSTPIGSFLHDLVKEQFMKEWVNVTKRLTKQFMGGVGCQTSTAKDGTRFGTGSASCNINNSPYTNQDYDAMYYSDVSLQMCNDHASSDEMEFTGQIPHKPVPSKNSPEISLKRRFPKKQKPSKRKRKSRAQKKLNHLANFSNRRVGKNIFWHNNRGRKFKESFNYNFCFNNNERCIRNDQFMGKHMFHNKMHEMHSDELDRSDKCRRRDYNTTKRRSKEKTSPKPLDSPDRNSRRSRSSTKSDNRDNKSNRSDERHSTRSVDNDLKRRQRSSSRKKQRSPSHGSHESSQFKDKHFMDFNPSSSKYGHGDSKSSFKSEKHNESIRCGGKDSKESHRSSSSNTAVDDTRRLFNVDTNDRKNRSGSGDNKDRKNSSTSKDKYNTITHSERYKSTRYTYSRFDESGKEKDRPEYENTDNETMKKDSENRQRIQSRDCFEFLDKWSNKDYDNDQDRKRESTGDQYTQEKNNFGGDNRNRESLRQFFSDNQFKMRGSYKRFARQDNRNRPFYKRNFRNDFKERFGS